MKSKKREREREIVKDENTESVDADQEAFIQAFQKPTQIYRYLRTRHIATPLFLHRTLTYNKTRCVKKKPFHVDDLLKRVEARQKNESESSKYKSRALNLNFCGFFDEQVPADTDTVEVEVLLTKLCHKKKKDITSPVVQTSLGKVRVPVNPSDDVPDNQPDSSQSMTVSQDAFVQTNGITVKSYALHLSVTCHLKRSIPNGLCNGDLVNGVTDDPPTKKRKSDKFLHIEDDLIVYGAEVGVYDRQGRCLLTDGYYELVLQELGSKSPPKKNAVWETIADGKAVGPFEVFNRCPALKFSITWKEEGLVNGCQDSGIKSAHEFIQNNQYSNHFFTDSISGYDLDPAKIKEENSSTPQKKQRIMFQFLYNSTTRQLTDTREDTTCPWCFVHFQKLYSLLKHLRLCHARFNFLYVPHPKGARIDVSINDTFDGSYSGNPQDLNSHVGYAFSRKGPTRRTSVTHVMVYRPKRVAESLTEFLELETENQVNRQFVQGHNRLYYRTATRLAVRPQEIEIDSEEENAPLWIQQKTVNMIDEFTDVNEGEKELTKLWNLHIMRKNYISDCQIPHACQTFVEEHGRDIVEKNLRQNFLLHMVNLFDFSLIKPEVVHRAMWQLDTIEDEMGID